MKHLSLGGGRQCLRGGCAGCRWHGSRLERGSRLPCRIADRAAVTWSRSHAGASAVAECV